MHVQILALQGGFESHVEMCQELGWEVRYIKLPSDISYDADLTIFPGGESTTISKLISRFGLYENIKKLVDLKMPIFGTCAGAILLSSGLIEDKNEEIIQFGAVKCDVKRNAYGSQSLSKEVELEIDKNIWQKYSVLPKNNHIKAAYIRAPKFVNLSKEVEILAWENIGTEMEPSIIKQGNTILSNCHPEVVKDQSIYRLFETVYKN